MLNIFGKKGASEGATATPEEIAALLKGFSIEIMPRTAAKIEDFKAILPTGTRVYIAHIDGTPIEDMVATAKRIVADGFPCMPHFPARGIESVAQLEEWIGRYREVGVEEGLMLAGGIADVRGPFPSSMEMMETGLFEKNGFTHLHIAGHPEGNKDIDADGSMKNVDAALKWKQAYSEKTTAKMAIATQFAFDGKAVGAWADRLKAEGITIPIHIGIAGPTKLQTLIKFSIACGVGASLKVLQKRALDLSKLLVPYEPTEVLAELVEYKKAKPDSLIEKVHFFPLGGIAANAEWAREHG